MYESVGAVGQQPLSNRPTSANASFGRTDRDQASRVYLTSRHEKANIGETEGGGENRALPLASWFRHSWKRTWQELFPSRP